MSKDLLGINAANLVDCGLVLQSGSYQGIEDEGRGLERDCGQRQAYTPCWANIQYLEGYLAGQNSSAEWCAVAFRLARSLELREYFALQKTNNTK